MSTVYKHFIGIDIGKLEFVVNVHGAKKTYAFNNELDGFNSLYQTLYDELKNGLVVLEVTGGYEISLINFLQAKEVTVVRANSRQVKSFIRSHGIIAKSDNIDACALSLYAYERQKVLKIYQPNKHDVLRKLNARRNDLVHIRVQEKNRSKAPDNDGIMHTFNPILRVLDEQITLIEKQIKSLIESDPLLRQKIQILKTVPGIGEITAYAILAEMPEIGSMNQKQVASLAGVAPHPNQSGLKTGYARTRGGRRKMRPILFIAALSVTRTKNNLGEFYHKLIARGKAKMTAIVALMRKLIVIANARIKLNINHS